MNAIIRLPARLGPRHGLRAVFLTILAMAGAIPSGAQDASQAARPTVVSLGSCTLASGAVLSDCRVAYRSFGRLNATRSNIVLVPTFFAGRSEDHAFMLGTYVDTTRYHVLIVDALADGHSSSPSNSDSAARAAFDNLTIGDMVETQRRLLVERLGISHVRAVVGISMGGFQALDWAVRYPTFADVVIPIVGTPRPTAQDRLIYDAIASAAEQALRSGAPAETAWLHPSRLEMLFMRTPASLNDSGDVRVARDVRALAEAYRQQGWSLADYAAQMRALSRQDLSAPFGGSMERAAREVRSRMLMVYSPEDVMVSSAPAAEFARLAGASRLEVTSACGHSVFWCEDARIGAAVRDFIDGGASTATVRRIGSTPGARR